MKKLTLFCYITVLLTFCYANEPLTQECLKNFLKDRQVTDSILDYVDGYVGSISGCESAVRTKLANVYEDLRDRLKKDRLSRPHAECVMKDIEEEDDVRYEDVILLELAVDMISNWRFWKYFDKKSTLESLRAKAENIVKESLLKCKGHRQFGDMFSNINDHSIVWNRSGEQEYCIRKTLVNKNLLDPRFYNFRENPRNVRTEQLDCVKVYDELAKSFYDHLKETENLNDCVLEVYKNNGYVDNILKAEVLSKLLLSQSNKTKEKQNFINNLVDITIETKDC